MDARKAEYWKVREIEWDIYRTEREKARVVDRAERIRKQELFKAERLDKSEKLLKACKKAEKKHVTISRRKRHCSDSGLPFDIWCKIFECLCDSIELEGVRGPSVVARELIHISMVSKELYTASLCGFQRLSQSCRTIKDSAALARPFLTWRRAEIEEKKPPVVREDALWDKLVSDPLSLKMTELKDLSATLGLYANGSDPKSTVTLDLFEFLGLQTPTRVPAQVILAVSKEKVHCLDQLAEIGSQVNRLETCAEWDKYKHLAPSHKTRFNEFAIRKECISKGLFTMVDLVTADPNA